jgi:restriction system protein
LKQLTPTGFEHFCMELLGQLGYLNVAVTKRSGDGGIDGYGDFRQGAVSIKSAFQAKRWTDTPVRRPDIDKLRGAIQGEYDHGVFITTSRFTKDAADASYKKGAITILLLDGDALAELMLDRGIGVVKQPLYLYEVASEFFDFGEDDSA